MRIRNIKLRLQVFLGTSHILKKSSDVFLISFPRLFQIWRWGVEEIRGPIWRSEDHFGGIWWWSDFLKFSNSWKLKIQQFPVTRFGELGPNKLRTIRPNFSVLSKPPQKPIWDKKQMGVGWGEMAPCRFFPKAFPNPKHVFKRMERQMSTLLIACALTSWCEM